MSRPSRAAGAPHAPRRGTAARVLGRLHITGVFWYRAHAFGVRLLPDAWIPFALPPIAFVLTRLLGGIARQVGSNLEAVLGPAGRRERLRRGRRTLSEFAWCLTERYERLCTGRRAHVVLENASAWHAAVREGGFVLLTAHVGVWEVGSLLPVTEEARRVHLVREEEMDPRAQRWFEDLLARRLEGLPYQTHFAGTDPGLGVRLLHALQAGDIVALQGDRPRAGGRILRTTLFGRPYPLPEGPPALARAAGVPLLPAFTLREGRRRYRVVFGDSIEVASGPDRAADLAAAAQAIAASVEGAIRRVPHQWFCFAPAFEGDPRI